MMPENNFSARIAFVDYDGSQAMKLYEKSRPRTYEECNHFVETAAPPRMVQGVGTVKRFIESL